MTSVRRAALFIILLVGLRPAAGAAQQLSLHRELPAIVWAGCPPRQGPLPAPASQARRDEAARLAAEARDAAILGDNAAAADLLGRAAAADPASPLLSYRLGRALEDLQRRDAALAEYCRFLAIAPEAPDAGEVRGRITTLTETPGLAVSSRAAQLFQAGLGSYDAGRLEDAELSFGAAIDEAPHWGAALYNRGLVRVALDRRDEAATDLRRYLELTPGAADFDAVLGLLGSFRGSRVAQPYNPAGALAAGLLIPGMGHFTTGRAATGMLFLGAAAGAVAAGVLMERVEVDCLSPPVSGACPQDQVLRREVTRPYLLPAAGAAAVVGVFGAIDAYRGAQRGNARNAALRLGLLGSDPGPVVLALPTVYGTASGLHLDLLRLRF